MSQLVTHMKSEVELVQRIRDRVKRAMHRTSESDIDVAHDRPDLRIRAAVELVLDEEVDRANEYLHHAESFEAQQEAANAEAAGR